MDTVLFGSNKDPVAEAVEDVEEVVEEVVDVVVNEDEEEDEEDEVAELESSLEYSSCSLLWSSSSLCIIAALFLQAFKLSNMPCNSSNVTL
tara:strand:+ start:289 stop:561 length:273 start_codon:yes stop_codon:yes gene_type:complete